VSGVQNGSPAENGTGDRSSPESDILAILLTSIKNAALPRLIFLLILANRLLTASCGTLDITGFLLDCFGQ